jgi:hypothetical protein
MNREEALPARIEPGKSPGGIWRRCWKDGDFWEGPVTIASMSPMAHTDAERGADVVLYDGDTGEWQVILRNEGREVTVVVRGEE